MLDTHSILHKFNNAHNVTVELGSYEKSSIFAGLSKDEAVNFILSDHLFTFFVLKHANAITPRQALSISSIVNQYGLDYIANIYSFHFCSNKRKPFSINTFDAFNYKKKSLFKAIISAKVTHKIDLFNRTTPETAFIVGLLSSIGNLPLIDFDPSKHYTKHLKGNTLPWLVQQSITGYNQFDISYHLLNSSNFPSALTTPVKCVLQYNDIDTNLYIKGLYGASLMSAAFTFPEIYNIEAIVEEPFFRSLGLSKLWLLNLYKEAIDTTSSRLLSNILSSRRTFVL